MSSRCHLFIISLTLIVLSAIASAASSSISTTTTASPTSTASTSTTVSIFPGTSAWVYYGCYNETVPLNNSGNLRALQGATESLDNMTVGTCLSFCGSDTFAGLKYASECYCANYISTSSTPLSDSECTLPCGGNSSQICGGSFRLTVYQKKTATKGEAVLGNKAPVRSILAFGIALAVLLCLA